MSRTSDQKSHRPPSAQVLGRLRAHAPRQSRYRLLGEIARGGMGAIIKIWDEDLRRTLAMKVVLGRHDEEGTSDTPSVDAKQLDRFLEEAQVTAQLDHPGIVPVHELGVDEEGQAFFTMRLVQGRDLERVFELVQRGEEDWSQARAVGALLKACEALAYAHDKQVIHRDLKPANIMVGRFGEVYVMDWGLARVLGEEDKKDLRVRVDPSRPKSFVHTDRRAESSADSPLLTMDGDVVGTPAYMPPEQARGDLAAMGPASDVYSLGAILYHLLAGHMPYDGGDGPLDAIAIWNLVQQGPPARLDGRTVGASPELIAICEKAMAREVVDRYPDVGAMAEDLRAYVEGRVVRAHRTGAIVELQKWVSRNRALALASAAAVAIALVGLGRTSYVQTAANEKLRARALELEAARSAAVDARDLAELQRYAVNVRSAGLALDSGLSARAGELLSDCPEEHRGWEWGHLDLQVDTSAATLRGHRAGDRVRTAELALGGERIVSATDSGELILWDATTGEQLVLLSSELRDAARSVDVSADGRRIAAATEDNRLHVWDADSGDKVRELIGHADLVYDDRDVGAIALAPDGRRLVSASNRRGSEPGGTIRIWDVDGDDDGLLQTRTTAPFEAPRAITFSLDGAHILMADVRGRVELWDATTDAHPVTLLEQHRGIDVLELAPDGQSAVVASNWPDAEEWGFEKLDYHALLVVSIREGGPLVELRGHEGGIFDAAFSFDGTRIASASTDRTVRVWDPADGTSQLVLEHDDVVRAVAFSPDGSLVVTGTDRHTLRLWNARNGELVATLRGHEGAVMAVGFRPDGSQIVSGAGDGTVRLWDIEHGEPSVTLAQGRVDHVAFSSTGARILSIGRPGDGSPRLKLWDAATGTLVASHGEVARAIFTDDGRQVLAEDRDGSRWRLDAESGAELAPRTDLGDAGPQGRPGLLIRSSSGPRILTPSSDGGSELWDAETGELLLATGPEEELAVTGDGGHLFSIVDERVRLRDAAGGDVMCTVATPSGRIVLSPDGSHIASSAEDGSIHLWRSADGMHLAKLHDQATTEAADHFEFSPDGSILLSVAGWPDSTLRLWSVESGALLGTDGGPGHGRIYSAHFTPDGRRVVTALNGLSEVHLLDTTTCALLLAVPTGPHPYGAISSPDGSQLLTTSADGLSLWPSDVTTARELARSEATREEALALVDRLAPGSLVEELVARIAEVEGIDGELRRVATRWALDRDEDPTVLNEHAWRVVDPDGEREGDVALALERARELVVRYRFSPTYTDTLAWALLANGQRDEAIATAEGMLEFLKQRGVEDSKPFAPHRDSLLRLLSASKDR